VHVDDLVKVAADSFELLLHVAPEGRGYFDMVTGDVELHNRLLLVVFVLPVGLFQ
jgi:hypothetical protein